MSLPLAERILSEVDPTCPWRTVDSFVESLAALSAVYRTEITRKTHQAGVTLAKLLSNMAAPGRVQWLFNNLRILHSVPPQQRSLMATGTTSNEAFHSQVCFGGKGPLCVVGGGIQRT